MSLSPEKCPCHLEEMPLLPKRNVCHCHLENVINTSKISLEEMSLSPKQDFFAIYTYLVN